MAKTHYRNIPCNSKSWSEQLAGGIILTPDTKEGKRIESYADYEHAPLPTTDDWDQVTCKKCLGQKPIDKNSIPTEKQQKTAINNLQKLIKDWPMGLVLKYSYEFGFFVVSDETREDGEDSWVAEVDAGNLIIKLLVRADNTPALPGSE